MTSETVGSGAEVLPVSVRPMTAGDRDAVHAIYADGIATGEATFECEAPTWQAFDAGRLPAHRLVAHDAHSILGWAAVSPVSGRTVAQAARGRGVEQALLQTLFTSTKADGIWTIQPSTFPENSASPALHERLGFRVVGHRERVGRMSGGRRMAVGLRYLPPGSSPQRRPIPRASLDVEVSPKVSARLGMHILWGAWQALKRPGCRWIELSMIRVSFG